MPTEIRVPQMGESVTEGVIAQWLKNPGDSVAADEPVVEVETDKITVEVPSPSAGVLKSQAVGEGDTVAVGDVLGTIDAQAAEASSSAPAEQETKDSDSDSDSGPDSSKSTSTSASTSKSKSTSKPTSTTTSTSKAAGAAMPAAKAEATRSGVDLDKVEGTGRGGRILKEDVYEAAHKAAQNVELAPAPPRAIGGQRTEERKKMTPLRKRVASRLLESQQSTATLTTFNEVDMSAVMGLRKRYKESFIDKHGVKLGFMSFFVKAAIEALKSFPLVNAEIDGEEVVYKNYYDIGVAVGSGKGLVVPVIRNADVLSFADIEKTIADFGRRARDNKLTLDDLTGGTFTISNGGVYGSMLSTPILNPPQCGILGLHNIVERPVAIDGEVEIRPVMFLALSYDHRLIDGREAVQFLITIKNGIENPERMLLEV